VVPRWFADATEDLETAIRASEHKIEWFRGRIVELERQNEHDALSLTEQCFFISGAISNHSTLANASDCQALVYQPTASPTMTPTAMPTERTHYGKTKKSASGPKNNPSSPLWRAPSSAPTARARNEDGTITCNRTDYDDTFFALTEAPTPAPTNKHAKTQKNNKKAGANKKTKEAKKAHKQAKNVENAAKKHAKNDAKKAKKDAKKDQKKAKKQAKKQGKKEGKKHRALKNSDASRDEATAAGSNVDKIYIAIAGSLVMIAAMAGAYLIMKRPGPVPKTVGLTDSSEPVKPESAQGTWEMEMPYPENNKGQAQRTDI